MRIKEKREREEWWMSKVWSNIYIYIKGGGITHARKKKDGYTILKSKTNKLNKKQIKGKKVFILLRSIIHMSLSPQWISYLF